MTGPASVGPAIGVLVIGDVVNDVTVRPRASAAPADPETAAPDAPENPGTTGAAGSVTAVVTSVPGGSASNLAAWLAAAGVPVRLAARIGVGDAGEHRQALAGAGVDVRLSVDPDLATGAVVSVVGDDGSRSCYTDRGANSRLDSGDLPLSVLDDIGHLHVSGDAFIEPASRAAVTALWRAAADSGLTRSVDFNSAGVAGKLGPDLLEWSRGAEIVFVNLPEGRAVTGADDSDEVRRRLLQHYPTAVLKLGPANAVVATRSEQQECPHGPGEVADPTGGGDAFDAGFLAAWLDRAGLTAAATAAAEARSVALGLIGGRPPRWTDVAAAVGIPWDELRLAADQASTHAYAPYSGLNVGAAGLTDDARILAACNVENASFGLSLCAECGLVSALRAAGAEQLVAVSIVGADGRPLTPCGRCRQVLLDNGGPGLLIDRGRGATPVTLEQLLPGAFDAEELFRRSSL